MTTEAGIGYGGRFEAELGVTPGDFAAFGEVTNITPPNESVDVIDVTHMDSPGRYREFIQGLTDPGDVSFDMNWVPGSDTEDRILAWRASHETRDARITTPNGITYTFAMFVTGYTPAMPVDGKMTATMTGKVTGPVTVGVAA